MTTALKDASLAGTISYNGFTFGAAGSTPPTYTIRGTPVYDEAGRAVTHVRYVLDVTAVVYADSEASSGAQIRQLRETLSRSGRKLEILDIGFGDTTVEQGASHPDVVWGAEPRLVSLEPVGGVLAWELHWQCEFNVSESATSRRLAGAWLAFNYQMSYAIDAEGFTTRSAEGYVRIVQTRGAAGDPAVGRTADAVRNRLAIVVPDGFRRKSSTWTESKDKTRLDFVVVDEELRTDAFPPGIVNADVEYRLENRGPGFTHIAAGLSGWMETAPGVPKSLAAVRLLLIVADKLQRLQRSIAAAGGGLVVPARLSIRHKLFSRRTWLAVEFHAVQCLSNLLSTGGMWDPVAGSDYRRWRLSVAHLWGNRGRARLKSRASDAVIIDLLDNPTDKATIGAAGAAGGEVAVPARPVSLLVPVTPQASWLAYRVRVRAHRRENVSVHTLSQEVETAGESLADNPGVGKPFRTGGPSSGRIRETHGEPIQQIRLEGVAVRLKYRPSAPVLTSVGGRRVHERDRSEERQQVTSFCGVPAYRLRWSVLYDVGGYVRRHDAPVNPIADRQRPWKTDL